MHRRHFATPRLVPLAATSSLLLAQVAFLCTGIGSGPIHGWHLAPPVVVAPLVGEPTAAPSLEIGRWGASLYGRPVTPVELENDLRILASNRRLIGRDEPAPAALRLSCVGAAPSEVVPLLRAARRAGISRLLVVAQVVEDAGWHYRLVDLPVDLTRGRAPLDLAALRRCEDLAPAAAALGHGAPVELHLF